MKPIYPLVAPASAGVGPLAGGPLRSTETMDSREHRGAIRPGRNQPPHRRRPRELAGRHVLLHHVPLLLEGEGAPARGACGRPFQDNGAPSAPPAGGRGLPSQPADRERERSGQRASPDRSLSLSALPNPPICGSPATVRRLRSAIVCCCPGSPPRFPLEKTHNTRPRPPPDRCMFVRAGRGGGGFIAERARARAGHRVRRGPAGQRPPRRAGQVPFPPFPAQPTTVPIDPAGKAGGQGRGAPAAAPAADLPSAAGSQTVAGLVAAVRPAERICRYGPAPGGGIKHRAVGIMQLERKH